MIISILTAVAGAVVSAVSTLGPMVVNLCTNVVPRILPVLRGAVEICKAVVTVAQTIGMVYDVLRPGESVQDMGERALQAGKGPEAFDDFEQYMQSLRDLKLDPARAQEFPAEAKLVAGLGVIAGGLDDRFRVRRGTMSNLWSLMAAPEFFTEARLGAILDHTREIGSVIKYFDGTLAPADAGRIEQALLDAERQLDPGHDEKRYLATLRDIGDRLRAGGRV
jgi:hypothetical protein